MKQRKQDYQTRLNAFLSQIQYVQALAPKEDHLYAIMDTVPFRDLETALMMATLESGPRHAAAND